MKIVLMIEGATERVFGPFLQNFIDQRLTGSRPRWRFHTYDGRLPKEDKLRRAVQNFLRGPGACDEVVALTDVYTGTARTAPPDFRDAADAKAKMRLWVGPEPRFHPHAAQHDFEAWLLPYWDRIQKLAGHNAGPPSGEPENVNHGRPPAHRIKDIFARGSCGRHYSKPRDARRILEGQDLTVAIYKCPELKALVNSILTLCGGTPLP